MTCREGTTSMENNNDFDPFWVFHALGASMTLGALAGLAAYLRNTKEVTIREWVAAAIYSGLYALATASLAFGLLPVKEWDLGSICLVLGISIISGLGGNAGMGIVIELASAILKVKGKP